MADSGRQTFDAKPKYGPVKVSATDVSVDLAGIFREAVQSAGATLAGLRGTSSVLSGARAAAADYGSTRGGDLITDIDQTTHDRVKAILGSALEKGQDPTSRLASLFGDDRANLIAQYETSVAWNLGVVSALKDAGEEYVYVSDGDQYDEECQNADGEFWTLEEAEANPLEHPWCVRDFRPLTEDELAEVKAEEADDEQEQTSVDGLRARVIELEQQLFDFNEDAHPRDEHGKFVEAGDASHLGGATAKSFVKDEQGRLHLFKPDPPVKIKAAAAASAIARHVDPSALKTFETTVGGKQGLVQPMIPGAKPLGSVASLSKEDVAAIQREHVIDWITSQHDSHPGQFVRDEKGNVHGVDKSQAWKYFPHDRLATAYHPNATYGERPPIYNTLFRPGGAGLKHLDPEAIRPLMDSIKGISHADVERILRPYADHVYGKGNPTGDKMIRAAYHRVRSAPADFSKFYSSLLGKSVKFSAEFDEEKHPRAHDGKFVDAGGSTEDAALDKYIDEHPIDEEAGPDAAEPVMAYTGTTSASTELKQQSDAAKAAKQAQLEKWKKYGATYRAKQKALKEGTKAVSVPKVELPTGKVVNTAADVVNVAQQWKSESASGGSTYGIDKVITSVTDAAHPAYAENWINLINENGAVAVQHAMESQSSYSTFATTKALVESLKTTKTDYILKGPAKTMPVENKDALRLAVAVQYGLTPREATEGARAISGYTGSNYSNINMQLRQGGGLNDQAAKMDRMMAKLPDIQSDEKRGQEFWRGMRLTQDKALITALKAGSGKFTDKAFVSASTSKSFAESWAHSGDGAFVLHWQNEGGFKNLTPWGSWGTKEGEVIGRPGMDLHIISSKYGPDSSGVNKWLVEVRYLPTGKAAAEPAQLMAPKGVGAAEKKYYYQKKLSPNTGKAYYVKLLVKNPAPATTPEVHIPTGHGPSAQNVVEQKTPSFVVTPPDMAKITGMMKPQAGKDHHWVKTPTASGKSYWKKIKGPKP